MVTNNSSPTGAAPAAAPPAACNATSGLQRASGATVATLANDQVDQQVDYTTASTAGQLAGSKAYRWSGWVYVPTADTYTWELQYSRRAERERHVRLRQQREPGDRRARDAHAGERAEHLRGDGARDADERRLHEALLTNQVCSTGTTATTCAAQPDGRLARGADHARRERDRDAGQLPVRVLARRTATSPTPPQPRSARARRSSSSTPAAARARTRRVAGRDAVRRPHDLGRRPRCRRRTSNLINAVAAANPNTIVVINNDNPVDTSWIGSAKSVLDMWFAGQEGGTSTARDPARPREPERPHGADVAGQPDGHDLGLQRAGRRALPGLDRRPAPRAAERQRRLRRHRQPGLARLPGRRRHERVRGHLHRLPLLRQARDHAARSRSASGLSYTTFAFSKLKVDADDRRRRRT